MGEKESVIMDIGEMATGGAMDAAVAERVLGFTHDGHSNWPHWGWPPGVQKIHGNQRRVLEYSTDIGAAMEVLDHLINSRAETVEWTLRGLHPGSGDSLVFTFTMHDWMNAELITSADGTSIPEAICRAAIKASESLTKEPK